MEYLPASMLQDLTNACEWAFAAPFLANRRIAHCRSEEALLYPPHLHADQIHENAGRGQRLRRDGRDCRRWTSARCPGAAGTLTSPAFMPQWAAMFARVIERSRRRDASNGR